MSAKILGYSLNKINIPAFLKSKEGQAFLAFMAGKNSKQIGAWLVKLGQTIGNEGVVSSGVVGMVGKTLLKAEWLAAAVCIAAGTISQAISNGEKVFNTADQRSGLSNILKAYWETSIPKATWDHMADFAKWLFVKPDKQATKGSVNLSPIKVSGKTQEEILKSTGTVTAQESGRQVVEHERGKASQSTPIKTTSDRLAEYMAKKNFKKDGLNSKNLPEWYVRGNAAKLNAGTLTWSTVKDNDRMGDYPFAKAVIILSTLNIPTIRSTTSGLANQIHPRIKEQVQLITAALRGKNTGAYQYNEQDVFNYIIEMGTIIARYNNIKRNLSILNLTNPFVESEAKTLFNQIYFSATAYDTAVNNRPNYISRLNALANVINGKAVPSLSLYSKWNYMASKLIKDYEGEKAVIGAFTITNWPQVDRTTGDITHGHRSATDLGTDLALLEAQVASLITIPSMLNTVAGVVNKISADFTKLLGANKSTFSNVDYASVSDVPQIGYDPAAFDQLHNAMMIGKANDSVGNVTYADWAETRHFNISNHTIVGSVGSGVCNNATPGAYAWGTTNYTPWLLTIDSKRKEASSPENIELTQYCFTYDAHYVADGTKTAIEKLFRDTPAAIIIFCNIVYFVPRSNTEAAFSEYGSVGLVAGTDIAMGARQMQVEKQISFYPPRIAYSENSGALYCANEDIDVDNFAYMNDNQYYNMNNMATYSLFYLYSPEDLKIMGILDVA